MDAVWSGVWRAEVFDARHSTLQELKLPNKQRTFGVLFFPNARGQLSWLAFLYASPQLKVFLALM
jgi:hypothetical protein